MAVWVTACAGLLAVTVAPGSAAPLPSSTVPEIEPALCARTAGASDTTSADAATPVRIAFITASPLASEPPCDGKTAVREIQ